MANVTAKGGSKSRPIENHLGDRVNVLDIDASGIEDKIMGAIDASIQRFGQERIPDIYVPAGSYPFTKLNLVGRDLSGLQLRGDGEQATVLQAQGGDGSEALRVTGDGDDLSTEPISTSLRHVTIRDMRITGINAAAGTSGLYAAHVQRLRILAAQIAQFPGDGIVLERPAHCAYVEIGETSWISSNGGWGLRCAGTKRISDLRLVMAGFSGNGAGGARLRADNFHAEDCKFNFCPIGVDLIDCGGWALICNRYEGNTDHSIQARSEGNEAGAIIGGRFFSGGDDPAVDLNVISGVWLQGLSGSNYGGKRFLRFGTQASDCRYLGIQPGGGLMIDNGTNNRDLAAVA